MMAMLQEVSIRTLEQSTEVRTKIKPIGGGLAHTNTHTNRTSHQ